MGGLGPGIGGSEWFIIGLVALLVVGPERLPGLLRQLGKVVAKARGMANEFRASFDEMARQSELDELRKEVEALRTGQNSPVRLGADADAAFKGIKDEFDRPLFADTTPSAASPVVPETVAEPAMTPAASEWPDGEPVMMPLATPPLTEAEPVAAAAPAKRKPAAKAAAPRGTSAKATPAKTTTAKAAKVVAPKAPASKAPVVKAPAAKAKAAPRAPAKARAPRNSKLDL